MCNKQYIIIYVMHESLYCVSYLDLYESVYLLLILFFKMLLYNHASLRRKMFSPTYVASVKGFKMFL